MVLANIWESLLSGTQNSGLTLIGFLIKWYIGGTYSKLWVSPPKKSFLPPRMSERSFLLLWRQKKVAFFGTSKNTSLTVTLQKEHKKENPLGFPADDAFEGPSCFCRALGLKDSHIKQKNHQSCIRCLHVVEGRLKKEGVSCLLICSYCY